MPIVRVPTQRPCTGTVNQQRRWVALLLLLLASTVNASDDYRLHERYPHERPAGERPLAGLQWEQTDHTLLVAWTLVSLLDGYTTHRGVNHGSCREQNPLLGSRPSAGSLALHNAVGIGVAWAVLRHGVNNPRSRPGTRWFIGAVTAGRGAAVAHNGSQDC